MIELANTVNPMLIIFLQSASLSSANRITASLIFKIKIGAKTVHTVLIKSTTPYSDVVSILVYNGTRKKLISREATFPIANIAVFFARYFPLLSDFSDTSFPPSMHFNG